MSGPSIYAVQSKFLRVFPIFPKACRQCCWSGYGISFFRILDLGSQTHISESCILLSYAETSWAKTCWATLHPPELSWSYWDTLTLWATLHPLSTVMLHPAVLSSLHLSELHWSFLSCVEPSELHCTFLSCVEPCELHCTLWTTFYPAKQSCTPLSYDTPRWATLRPAKLRLTLS